METRTEANLNSIYFFSSRANKDGRRQKKNARKTLLDEQKKNGNFDNLKFFFSPKNLNWNVIIQNESLFHSLSLSLPPPAPQLDYNLNPERNGNQTENGMSRS
jgi:hypothetical protein